MIYRVIMKVNFYERLFDFADMEEASIFATAILTHQIVSEDHKKVDTYVTIKVMTKEED